MNKKFLMKISIVFLLVVCTFLLQWKTGFAKTNCTLNIPKMNVEKCCLSEEKVNVADHGSFPYDDFLIKI